jgi:hypothetical protein
MRKACRFATEWRTPAAWLWLAPAVLLALGSQIPPVWLERAPVLCPFRRLLDIPCLGCGATRAFVAACHGDFTGALRLNPLGLLAWFGLAAGGATGLVLLAVQIPRWLHDRQIRVALAVVWLVVSLVLGAAALAPFALPAETLGHLFPPCPQLAATGRPCPLCGMTSAYLAIAHGDWREAARDNEGAIPLWTISLVNLAVCAAFTARRARWQGDQSLPGEIKCKCSA